MFSKNYRNSKNSIASSFSSIYSNICKSRKCSDINLNILNQVNKNINYDKIDGNIIKTFFKRHEFDLELYYNFKLNEIDMNISPEILHIEDNDLFSTIKYNTTGLLSLRSVLSKERKYNFNYIINELVSFLTYTKDNKVIIGNLHIDNIFINIETMQFFIIDLININFLKVESNLDFRCLSVSLESDYFNENIKTTPQDVFVNDLIECYTNFT